ncbi:hypothetical protein [Allokutzneria oryzae]|uniref:Uncharacterized protein n=1 Tax=Allokutzneria oryzae TaxID=1378989 RepID=A0ABV5ZV65_9PSEU
MVREDDMRATFDALSVRESPPLAFTAADVIANGGQVRKRRTRNLAVAGTTIAVAAVVAGVFVLSTDRVDTPPENLTPANTPATTSQLGPRPASPAPMHPTPFAPPAPGAPIHP